METLGKRVATARIAIGMSQEVLAEKAETTRQTIGNIERDVYRPSADLLYALAKSLQRSMEWFMDGSDPVIDPLEGELARIGVNLDDLKDLPRHVIEGMLADGRLDWIRSLAMGRYEAGESVAKAARRRRKK